MPLSSHATVIYTWSWTWLPLLFPLMSTLTVWFTLGPWKVCDTITVRIRCFLAGMTWFHSELNITAPRDGTAGLALTLPQKTEKRGLPLEPHGHSFLCRSMAILEMVYFVCFLHCSYIQVHNESSRNDRRWGSQDCRSLPSEESGIRRPFKVVFSSMG